MSSNQVANLAGVFLEKYKSLELALRTYGGDDMTVLKYEDSLTGDDSDKMRISRIMRNFLQHNPNAVGFVQPTQMMIDFIVRQTDLVLAATEKAKDRLFRLGPLKDTMTVHDACRAFLKAKLGGHWIPVVNADGKLLGVMTEAKLVQAMAGASVTSETPLGKAVKKTELAKSLENIPVIFSTDDLAPYAKTGQDVIVLRNGKYSGVIIWQTC